MPQLFTGGREQRAARMFDSAAGQLESGATAANDAYLARALSFDPSQAVDQYGQGFMDEAREGLGQDFDSLVGNAVGQGRLRTGFFQRDAGRLFQDFNRRVANAIAMQSMNAADMQMRNTNALGAYGQNMMGQQIDLIGGALDRANYERERDRDRGLGGLLKKGLGLAAGAAFGPVGAAVGGWAAGKMFGDEGRSDADQWAGGA